jgi:renalase
MKAAIIGAGLTGLTAARELHEAGVEVHLFEKSRGLGGRMSTKRRPWAWLDLGAQYFTARDPHFVQQVEQWIDQGAAKQWHPNLYAYQNGSLVRSEDDTKRYVGTPKMNAVVHAIGESLDVQLHKSTRIERVEVENENPVLWDTDGQSYGPFDHVIATVPSPQAGQLFRDQAELSEQINAFPMAPTWAVGFHLVESLLINSEPVDGIFVKDRASSWIARNSAKAGRIQTETGEDWVVHMNSEWSQRHIEADPEYVRRSARVELAEVLGNPPVNASQSVVHRWRYARNAADSLTDERGFLTDGDHPVWVAGDWLLGGRVEAAYLSGRRVAHAVLTT